MARAYLFFTNLFLLEAQHVCCLLFILGFFFIKLNSCQPSDTREYFKDRCLISSKLGFERISFFASVCMYALVT